jgi:hypothetical protein
MRGIAAGLAALLFSGAVLAQPAQRPAPLPVPLPPMPSMVLPFAKAQGDRAIAALGDRLPEVAAAHGMDPRKLVEELRNDRTLWLDRNGRLFYVEERVPAPAGAGTATGSATYATATTIPLDQTFRLNSRPGASRTIYLDFDGHTITGSAWNSMYGSSSIQAAPFDLDGLPGTFSTAEMQRIQAIWQRVAEDYAPFDVNVTTQDPGVAALNRSGTSDATFGIRVIVTRDFTASTSSPCNCGGKAYIGVFDQVNNETYQPALVFFDQLGGGNEKYVAEAISHEAGHNLGLSHDGTSSTGYYSGQGSGETGWAPIMGVGYYQNLVQWSRGEYAGANNTQDDIAVIQSRGAPLRADDHGDTIAAATAFAAVNSGGLLSLTAEGVIGTRADVDVFRFDAGAGTATFTVAGAPRGPNLDAGMDLLDGQGRIVASASPSTSLGATMTVTLPAPGRYYLAVGGVANGDPATTGYSDYGSLGQYTVTGTAQPMAGTVPVAVASASATSGTAPMTVSFDGSRSYDADGSIVSYAWSLGNGTTASGPTATAVYSAQGRYLATLTVTDNAGLSASTTVTVDVGGTVTPTPTIAMAVTGVTITLSSNKGGTVATANVAVRDVNGNAVVGAAVTGTWSGSVSGTGTGTTGSTGVAAIASQRSKRSGSATFTVTGVTLSGYAYDPARSVTTSATAAW